MTTIWANMERKSPLFRMIQERFERGLRGLNLVLLPVRAVQLPVLQAPTIIVAHNSEARMRHGEDPHVRIPMAGEVDHLPGMRVRRRKAMVAASLKKASS
ncbi:hypothetical protein M408DRAFT_327338 [Serendipita vermifera MAFF 305830]|uniref:Uncharacterized protein n=1 Tax=Serendipita vermifera MAFF 305830 TaxID=933852 RepID=A0A0C2XSQ9_SERVB|nr:hypothetical protein M408DRAFT_327338 [Serendipita vermifera MAFF 305830]